MSFCIKIDVLKMTRISQVWKINFYDVKDQAQLRLTCSKSTTTETLEKDVKYVKS